MSGWARVRLYAAIVAGAVGLLVGVGVSVLARLDGVWSHLAWTGMVVVPLYALAVWLVHHRPDHPQARRMLLIAAVSALGVAVESVVRWAYRDVGDVGWLWYGNFVHQFLNVVGGVAGGVLLACYPDGTADKPWQRRLVAGLWCLLSLPLLMLLTHQTLVASPYLFEGRAPDPPASPFLIEWLTPLGPLVEVVFTSSAAAAIGAAVLLVRYAQSRGTDRLRMRPLVYTIFISIPVFGAVAAMLMLHVPEDSPWFLLASFLSFPVMLMFPISIAISVLRYRVFDIDVALRRSAVYGVLVVVIAAVYVALAAAPGLALGNQVPVQLAVVVTVVAAVVFQPLRRRLESVADRWVFGERANRYQL